MFEQLAELLKILKSPTTGGDITAALRLFDRFLVLIAEGIGEWDAREDWKLDGHLSPVAWLMDHGGLSRADANDLLARARLLRGVPLLAEAARSGALSRGQLHAIRTNISAATTPLFAKGIAQQLPTLLPLKPGDVAMVMREWQSAALDAMDATMPAEAVRSLHISQTQNGVWYVNAVLDEAAGVIVSKALSAAMSDDTDLEPERDPARRRADALVAIAQLTLDESDPTLTGRNRPHLDIVIDVNDVLTAHPEHARTVDGHLLDPISVMQLACDPIIHRVLMAASTVLDHGRGERLFTDRQRRVLELRDGGCRWPGCDRGVRWCHAHHVIDWTAGGPSDIGNGVLLCGRHHRLLHTPGHHATIDPDATFTVQTPYGQRTTRPKPPPRPPGTLPT